MRLGGVRCGGVGGVVGWQNLWALGDFMKGSKLCAAGKSAPTTMMHARKRIQRSR